MHSALMHAERVTRSTVVGPVRSPRARHRGSGNDGRNLFWDGHPTDYVSKV